LDAQVLGVSVDHIPSLKAWAESLGGISYPLLADFWPHGEVAQKYGVLRQDGRSERAIFLIDPEGTIRYIDIHDIDEQPDNEVLFAEIAKIHPEGQKALEKEPPKEAPLPSGGVIMYCNAWCPDCRKARNWLLGHNIDFREVDIHKTPGAVEQVRKWANGKLVTPSFDVNGTIVVDFDREKLAAALKI
jgi:glutaredoxin